MTRATETYDFVSLGVAAASLIASVVSLIVSCVATSIAKSSLCQARQVANRDREEWKQRKWYDLYFKASEAYDFFDYFQKKYISISSSQWGTTEWHQDWTKLMFAIREVHTMAVVFPVNPIIDELCSSTAVFKEHEDALSEKLLERVLNAIEAVRTKALVDASVLR